MRGGFASSLALLAVAACSFPDVSYATADGSTSSDGAQSGDSPAGGDSGAGDATATADAPEDRAADAANEPVSEAAPDAPPCDQDEDGFTATSCGGNDCCDTDKLAHPNQTGWFDVADGCQSFDYDCSGKLEKEYDPNVSCTGLAGLCSSTYGFTGDPGCGSSGPYVTCGASGLSCVALTQTTQTQACH